MRIATMLGAAALMMAGGAGAQAPGASYPVPGARMPGPPPPPPPLAGGRWSGGNNAPGGWAAYRAPYRGYRLPRYWVAPRFYVNDWSRYGFRAPAAGQYWTRYYDDAVLIDGRGEVYDTVGGVEWDGRGRHDGLAGAAVGAVAGGIAGNVIAGRGDRLGGTLIGAGVGAAAGYAIDREHGRDRHQGYRDGPMRGDYPPPPPPPPYDDGPRGGAWVSPDGSTTVTTTTGGGYGYPVPAYGHGDYGYAGGYGGSVTTVTVQSAPVVTTTTTEVIEDRVAYRRAAARKVYRKRVWHPRPRRRPACVCGS